MSSRRQFIVGLAAAAGVTPMPLWADAGRPRFLAAGKTPYDDYVLAGLDGNGNTVFTLPLPARGHAAAAHPFRPEAVAFARRPGTFALVIDCRAGGTLVAKLDAPDGRHFFGHGAFSSDGSLLFTTENAYAEGEGRIGIWDASGGYRRLGEFQTNGTGPHEMLRLPGTDTLVVANGGIETHPDSGRTKLNLGFMDPSLAYFSLDGRLLDQVRLDPKWHMHSIRHLAARTDGTVAAACQWQGDPKQCPPLLFLHKMGEEPRLMQADPAEHNRMNAYAGSVAFSGDGSFVAISGPRGGRVQVFDVDAERFSHQLELTDACGVAASPDGIFCTSGEGVIATIGQASFEKHVTQPIQWDNHLVALT